MGPWFWALDALGRARLGGAAAVAGHARRWWPPSGRAGSSGGSGLSRAGALAGTARLPAHAVPARVHGPDRPCSSCRGPALPWLIGLTDRAAARAAGWRDPALIALVVLTIGAVNASSLVLIGVGPLLWLLAGDPRPGRARAAAAGVGRHGRAAEPGGVAVVDRGAAPAGAPTGCRCSSSPRTSRRWRRTSTPSDVLRGLGNWFFYGQDRLGYSIDQAEHYVSDRLTVAVTFAPGRRRRRRRRSWSGGATGPASRPSCWSARWSSVGAWPLDDPSPFARAVAELHRTPRPGWPCATPPAPRPCSCSAWPGCSARR